MTPPKATTKPRILCLHGMSQSAAIFSNKIAGARRKLSRLYDLDFLDGPVELDMTANGSSSSANESSSSSISSSSSSSPDDDKKDTRPLQYGWWIRNEQGQHIQVQAPFDYIQEHINKQSQPYDALLGFSQGGLLATALAVSGQVPVKAVVTAGAPYVEDAFEVAQQRLDASIESKELLPSGLDIPKLHFAGETDAIIAVERVQALSERGGNGRVLLHDKGHLFPTKSVSVQAMLDFLQEHVLIPHQEKDQQEANTQ